MFVYIYYLYAKINLYVLLFKIKSVTEEDSYTSSSTMERYKL